MIIVTGSILARPETFAAIRVLALQHVARSRGKAGCEHHAVHVDAENPLRLVFVEQWTGRAALATHFADPQAKAFVAAIRPLAAEAPTMESEPCQCARPVGRVSTLLLESLKDCEETVLRDAINNALKDAMKARDERRVSTLRLVNAALKNADLEAQGQGKAVLADDELLALMQKMIKQRQESVEIYDKAGRPELAAIEREEIAIIAAYLPQQMAESEIVDVVAALVKETGASAMKDMGRVMAAIKERYAGKLDFAKASAAVKKLLSGG